MRYVAGIDGGQSSTKAVVADETGRVLGRGSAGPADEVGQGPGSTRLRDALAAALEAARAGAGLPEGTRFEAIVAGVSGYGGAPVGVPADLPARRSVVLHDAPVAHAAALSGEPGVAVIAGTGSVVYAAGGTTARTFGGWGYLFGDEGSAFWFARETLAALMRAADLARDGEAPPPEAALACAHFGAGTLRELAAAFYRGALGRDRVAAFAPVAASFAGAPPLLDRGFAMLAQLVAAAVAWGAPPAVALTGGFVADPALRARAEGAVLAAVPQARIVRPAHEPAVGALLLAYKEAGLPLPAIAAP